MPEPRSEFGEGFDVGSELQGLFEEGVRFSLELLRDGTFQVYYGDYQHEGETQTNVATVEEAVNWLREKAGHPRNPMRA